MKLNDAQKTQVSQWIEQGLKLSEIQNRIALEFKASLTYMEVRFLVDDLKLTPKDPTPAPAPNIAQTPATPPLATKPVPANDPEPLASPSGTGTSNVSVTVDQLARPGALVSGKVIFGDGQKADWSLDQMGRLGLAAQQKGYRPSQADLQEFQLALQSELAKMGF